MAGTGQRLAMGTLDLRAASLQRGKSRLRMAAKTQPFILLADSCEGHLQEPKVQIPTANQEGGQYIPLPALLPPRSRASLAPASGSGMTPQIRP